MRVAAKIGVLHGEEGACPPLPFVTVDDKEGISLIKRGLAIAVAGGDGDAEPESEKFDLGADIDFIGGAVVVQLTLNGVSVDAPIVKALPSVDFDASVVLADGNVIVQPLVDGVPHGDPIVSALPDAAPIADQTAEASDNGPDAHTELHDAFDLLGEDDFVKTGDRAGRPKVDAVKAILDRDIGAEEIDTAWGVKQSAEA